MSDKTEDQEIKEEAKETKNGKKDKKAQKKGKKGKKMAPRRKFILLALLPIVAVALFLTYDVMSFLGEAPSEKPKEIEFTVLPGSTFQEIAEKLYEEGLITNVRAFVMYARYKGITETLRSGHYTLNTSWPPPQLIDHLMVAKPKLETITIPEGLPWWEVGRRFEMAGLIRFEDFRKTIHNPTFLAHWNVPFDNAEGFLFPDTYKFHKPLVRNERSAQEILGHLLANFWKRTRHVFEEEERSKNDQKKYIQRIMTLASIVEKETASRKEYARIAGVFANRLNRDMRLQADPTIIYGLGQKFDGNITKANLQDKKNPYNTYQIDGLPPGPIASPGLAAIEAAGQPERHNYLFFVSKNDGTHVFTSNLRDHNRAVNLYQKRRRGDGLRWQQGGTVQ